MTMPVPSQISTAAHAYRQNAALLNKSFDGLTAEEWLAARNRPQTPSFGFWVTWSGRAPWRSSFSARRGSGPGLSLFARGAKLPEPSQYPLAGRDDAWLAGGLRQLDAGDGGCNRRSAVRSGSGKVAQFRREGRRHGRFLAFHEAYHVGQAAYLRCWMGHDQIIG